MVYMGTSRKRFISKNQGYKRKKINVYATLYFSATFMAVVEEAAAVEDVCVLAEEEAAVVVEVVEDASVVVAVC